jgi:hypothetical protein
MEVILKKEYTGGLRWWFVSTISLDKVLTMPESEVKPTMFEFKGTLDELKAAATVRYPGVDTVHVVKALQVAWQSFEAPPMPEAFAKLCQLDPMLESVWQEANHPRYRQDPSFCRNQLWNATPRASGGIGLKFLLEKHVGTGAAVKALRTEDAWMIACAALKQAMPKCAHPEGETWTWKDSQGNVGAHGQEDTCTHTYPLEGKGNRFEGQGFSSVVERLNEWAGGPLATVINVKHIPDDQEPVFVVNSPAMADQLYTAFRFERRLADGKISKAYHDKAFVLLDGWGPQHTPLKEEAQISVAAERKDILGSFLTRENITGQMKWRHVVLTFKDDELLELLTNCCVSVQFINLSDPACKIHTLDQFYSVFAPIALATDVGLTDMPDDVLDGGLGEICRKHMDGLPRAYAWPSLLLAASVFIQARCQLRTNLYVNLVGPIGSGKSSAMQLAARLLGLTENEWRQMQFGSFEGLSQDESLSKANGANRLVWVDELVHLLTKAGIQSSTLANNLDTLFYQDKQQFIIAHGKKIEWNCRLSIGGGMPEDAFGDLFGANTIGGFYDRFLFSMAPTDYAGYSWRPLDAVDPVRSIAAVKQQPTDYEDVAPRFTDCPPASAAPLQSLTVDKSVWQESDKWKREFKIDYRCVEIALRAAAICAAFDGRATLHADDLRPALALAKYQQRVRAILSPNPGKDDVAIIQRKVLTYLLTKAANGQAVNRRTMYMHIRAYDYDLLKVERAINNLVLNGDVETYKVGKATYLRLAAHLVQKTCDRGGFAHLSSDR